MNRIIETLEIVRLGPDRNKLIAGALAIALIAGAAGVLIGRSGSDAEVSGAPSTTTPAVEEPLAMTLAMTPQLIASNGITVTRVGTSSLRAEIVAPATVTAPPEGRGVLTARADGAVVRVFKRLGDPVAPGETIALLESRDASALVAQRSSAAAQVQAARSAATREQRLFDEKITARQDLEAAVATRRIAEAELARTDAAIRAAGVTGDGRHVAARSPIGGRITKVGAELGAYVSAGAELFEVADPRSVQVEAAVPLAQARLASSGDPALIDLPDGSVVDAVVRSTTPALDPTSRTATVILQLRAAAGGLTQGQAVRVRILPRGSDATAIVLPEDAVQTLNGRDIVFVRTRNGFRAAPVSLGQRSAGRVEILLGIKAGDKVATGNAYLLKADLGKAAGEEE